MTPSIMPLQWLIAPIGAQPTCRTTIRTLRWRDVDGGTLNLADAKSRPRRVFLNAPARAILERQPRSGSTYVFPSPGDPGRPLYRNLSL